MAKLNLMCEKCGRTTGPPLVPNAKCLCGGTFEYMPEDILKGLGSFAPSVARKTEDLPPKRHMNIQMAMAGAAVLLSAYVMGRASRLK